MSSNPVPSPDDYEAMQEGIAGQSSGDLDADSEFLRELKEVANETLSRPEPEKSEEHPAIAEAAQLKDQLIRSMAENENLRKRAERDQQDARKYAVTGFARDIVNVVETLQLALANVPEGAAAGNAAIEGLVKGVDMTQQELLKVLERNGITRIDPKGEKFDHNYHQAIAQVDEPGAEANSIVQVLQAGYVIHDRLLRPAMVTVAKGGGDPARKVDTQA